MTKFVRPTTLKFPLIFHTFEAKDNKTDEIVEYRIQDLPEEDYARAVDLIISDFVPEETLCLCRDILNDVEGLKEIREFWANELKAKISVACYKNVGGCTDLVGVNILRVVSKGEPEFDNFKTASVKDIFGVCEHAFSQHNIFEIYGVSEYLNECGLVTNKNYRKRGIATEILKARVAILKALNLQVTSTIFTVIGSQKAAINANYDEGLSMKWTDFGKDFKDFDFTKAISDCCKILDFKI